MLSGLDLVIVGTYEAAEYRCRSCSIKRYGEPRAQRIMAGLESSNYGPDALPQWEANEEATDRGHDCDCDVRPVPIDESCPSCGVLCCIDCGARLDEVPCAA